MARKVQLDASIVTDMRAVVTDSFKESILMIEVGKIKPSLDNFYSLDEIEMLADDIERQGLKHNLVVTEDAETPGTYFIKSGHRRFTAIQLLISESRYTSNFVPCLVDGTKTQSETMLDLIMLNATTRVMTDAELYKQYEVLRDTLEQLKKEGKKLKGRLREKVAAFLNVSPAQVGKIENIRHNAVEEVQSAVESGELSIATADRIAKLSEDEQRDLVAEHDLSEIRSTDVPPKSESAVPKLKSDTADNSQHREPEQPTETNEEDDDSFSESNGEITGEPENILSDLATESGLSEEEYCERYCTALTDTVQNFLEIIRVAKNMKSIDRAVVRMQSELKKIMEEI